MKILDHVLDQFPPESRALMTQLVRYAAIGLGVTLAQALVYYVLATRAAWHEQLANLAGYGVAVALGYVLHGRVTFRDAQRPGTASAHIVRGGRFVAVSLFSLALNALWVWLCVTQMGWPEWAPIPAMVFVTPAFVFVLNKRWVFG